MKSVSWCLGWQKRTLLNITEGTSFTRASVHTVGLFHSMAAGTLWLKKSEESVAGKSGSSNRTPFCRHSSLSCSKDFPSDCVSSALPGPELLPDKVDWMGIFFNFVWMSEGEMWGDLWGTCYVSDGGTSLFGRLTHPHPDTNWFVLLQQENSPLLALPLSLWARSTRNCKNSLPETEVTFLMRNVVLVRTDLQKPWRSTHSMQDINRLLNMALTIIVADIIHIFYTNCSVRPSHVWLI